MNRTPKELGYFFPAEWHPHTATWLTWPQNAETWLDTLELVYPAYCLFIKHVSEGEVVNIIVHDEPMKDIAVRALQKVGCDLKNIRFHFFGSNDSWCRDHGPAFLINPDAGQKKIIVDWNYNAWGGKYPPYDKDDQIPGHIAAYYGIPSVKPGLVMEGGSVEFNGKGTLLTTTACLLNKNRNPHLSQKQIEQNLVDYYGVDNILWLHDGIVGDDTDGHIDDVTRFVNEDTVVTAVEHDKNDDNYHPLHENLQELKKMRLENGKQLNIVELPMPGPVVTQGQRLPASYANFYISNAAVVVPTFRHRNDDVALQILSECFPERKVVGVDSVDIIWGLGSFHCLSQQEPAV